MVTAGRHQSAGHDHPPPSQGKDKDLPLPKHLLSFPFALKKSLFKGQYPRVCSRSLGLHSMFFLPKFLVFSSLSSSLLQRAFCLILKSKTKVLSKRPLVGSREYQLEETPIFGRNSFGGEERREGAASCFHGTCLH